MDRPARQAALGVDRRRVATLVAIPALLRLTAGLAAAHGQNHASHAGSGGFHPAVAASVFLGSVLLLGAAVYLDRSGSLDRTLADAGVAVGVVGLLASIALLLV